MTRYHPWRVVAMCGGVALTAVDLIAVVTGLTARSAPLYLMAGGIVTTIAIGVLDPLARYCWRHRNFVVAGLCWAMIPVCGYQVVTSALERSATAQDAMMRKHEDLAYAIQLTKERRAEAVAERNAAQTKQAELEKKAAEEKLRGGCKSICEGFLAEAKVEKEKAEAAQARIAELDAKLEELGPPTEDPLMSRLASWLPFLSKETIVALHPLVLPLAVPILGAILIDVSLTGGESVPKQRSRSPRGETSSEHAPKRRTRASGKKRGRKPKPPKLAEGNVIALHR